jgi:hypothetical protein
VSNEESSPAESEVRARYDGRSWEDKPIYDCNLQRRRVVCRRRVGSSSNVRHCLKCPEASARGRYTAERAGIQCRYADMCESRLSSQASHMSKRQSTEEHG